MQLTREEVLHIAKLARIALTDGEVEKFRTQLSSIVDFISQLKEVDVTGVEPTAQVTGLTTVLRPDAPEACDAEIIKKLVAQFPDAKDGMLKVPPVFE